MRHLFHAMRRTARRWLIARTFNLIRDGDLITWSQLRGPGTFPLPWAGPNGEVVLVTLDARGRIVGSPAFCDSPRMMMRVLALTPPDFVDPPLFGQPTIPPLAS